MRALVAHLCPTLQPHGLKPTRLLGPWNSPAKNTGVGSHSLLQGIFLIQGSNLVSCIAGIIPYHLSCYYSYSMPLSSDTTVYVSFKICLFFEGTNKMYLPERLYTWQSSYLLVMYATRFMPSLSHYIESILINPIEL